MMRFLPFLAVSSILLSSCTGVAVGKSPKGHVYGGVLSLLGDQTIAKATIHLPEGMGIELEGYSTKNPSDNVVKIVERYFYFEGAKYLIRTAADITKLRDGFAHSEKLREFDLAAQKQGFEQELALAKLPKE